MICQICHAGQMLEYRKEVGPDGKGATLTGLRCERCGYTSLGDDEDVWKAVGL